MERPAPSQKDGDPRSKRSNQEAGKLPLDSTGAGGWQGGVAGHSRDGAEEGEGMAALVHIISYPSA